MHVTSSTSTSKSPRTLRLAVGGVALALAAAVGGVALASPDHGPRGGHAMMSMGGPMGGGAMMGGRGLERMLEGVNATDAQRSQIRQIIDAARADARAQREQAAPLREQAMRVFTQPNIDANAAEALRQQMLARHDQASKRHLQTMLDVARVLTPEQRQQIAQRMAQRAEMMQRHQRERAADAPKR